MRAKYNRVYQFRIRLEDIEPDIWRVIQVPETYSFWDLHIAIQDAMGWHDYHLHEFILINSLSGKKSRIGIPPEEILDDETIPGWKEMIADYFSMENKSAIYIYDFGDNWQHNVTLEEILPEEEKQDYPRCIDGQRACPPEDCGSIPGYEDILEILDNPDDEEYEETLEWLGGEYDPEHFDPAEVHFDDPEERFKKAFDL
jgi:hypothetical protein